MTSPAIILVEPQMGENIGAVARVMSNFGLSDLRIIAPRDGWPNDKAISMAAHGKFILDNAVIHDCLDNSISDLNFVAATTAVSRSLQKPVLQPFNALNLLISKMSEHNKTGILFGRERIGLLNEEITLCDFIITIPSSDLNTSLNLAQAVCVISYEYYIKTSKHKIIPQAQANKQEVKMMLTHLEEALSLKDHFKVDSKKQNMMQNIKNIFYKAQLTSQEVKTLRGIIKSLHLKS